MNDNPQKLCALIDTESCKANTHGILLGVRSAYETCKHLGRQVLPPQTSPTLSRV